MRSLSPARAAALVVLAATIARLLFAGFTGLGIDESYMVAASHRVSLYYFDHPPAAWWLELAARAAFGSAAPLAVRLPFILCAALSSWLLYGLAARLHGARAGFWAVAAFSISPLFSLAFGTWVLPDGPLDVFLLAAAACLARALGIGGKAEPAAFLAAGLFAGLALDAKYNAALVLLGGLLFLLTDAGGRRALRTPWPWLGGAAALAVFAPVVAANARHGFASFAFQGDRALGLRFHPLAPLTIWAGEALFVLPWLWLPMVALGARAFGRGAAREARFLAWLAAPAVIVFAVIGLWSSTRILYHWAAPGYLMLFPMLGAWVAGLAARPRRAAARVAGGTALLLALAPLFIALEARGVLPSLAHRFAPGRSPLLQIADWSSAVAALPAAPAPVATTRWYDSGKIGYALAARGERRPVFVLGRDPREFGQSAPAARFLGQDIILLMPQGEAGALAGCFAALAPLPPLPVTVGGQALDEIPAYIGHDLRALPPACP